MQEAKWKEKLRTDEEKRQEELRTANKRLRERQNETAFYIVGAFLFWMWVPIIIFFEINLISVVIALILTAIIILRWKYILKTTKELNIDSSRHGFIKSLLTFLIACTISSCVGIFLGLLLAAFGFLLY